MDSSTVAALIDRVSAHWQMADGVEITLEANPTSVEVGRLADFRAAGVNRISLGIQALNDRALLFLGRNHSAHEAIKAIELADRLFGRFSFDLIYARPEQTVAAWREGTGAGIDVSRRPHLRLPTDNRGRNRISRAQAQRRTRDSRRCHNRGVVRGNAGSARNCRLAGL